jgi:hypothetical protein
MGEFSDPPRIWPDGCSADLEKMDEKAKHATTSSVDFKMRDIVFP